MISLDPGETTVPVYCLDHRWMESEASLWLEREGYYWCDAGHYEYVSTSKLTSLRLMAQNAILRITETPIIHTLGPLLAAAALFGIAVMHHHWVGHQQVWDHLGCWARYQLTNCTTPPQF